MTMPESTQMDILSISEALQSIQYELTTANLLVVVKELRASGDSKSADYLLESIMVNNLEISGKIIERFGKRNPSPWPDTEGEESAK